jgi:hypothetical protein
MSYTYLHTLRGPALGCVEFWQTKTPAYMYSIYYHNPGSAAET